MSDDFVTILIYCITLHILYCSVLCDIYAMLCFFAGNLGHGDKTSRQNPTLVSHLSDFFEVIDLSCGRSHCAVIAEIVNKHPVTMTERNVDCEESDEYLLR